MAYKYYPRNTEYKREWMRERRAEYLAGKKCRKCGSKKNLVIATIDYSKPNRKHTPFSFSPKRQKEIFKNKEVLCRTHYREALKLRKYPIVHGTRMGYRTHNCKCKKCMAAAAKYSRDLRARKKEARRILVLFAAKRKGLI